MERFAGTCEALAPVDVSRLTAWIAAIPFEDWPQQRRLDDGMIRPAMLTDLQWHGFAAIASPVVGTLLEKFPGCEAFQWMLSVVMPGHSIPPHRDEQPPSWLCRVHVPLTSNEQSAFVVGGAAHQLSPGTAYRVNTEAEHSVTNDGNTPRIHFMFDVRKEA